MLKLLKWSALWFLASCSVGEGIFGTILKSLGFAINSHGCEGRCGNTLTHTFTVVNMIYFHKLFLCFIFQYFIFPLFSPLSLLLAHTNKIIFWAVIFKNQASIVREPIPIADEIVAGIVTCYRYFYLNNNIILKI